MNKVLILGGYGNFGKRIAHVLTQDNIAVIIAGRNRENAEALVRILPEGLAEAAIFDIDKDFEQQLESLKPALVINTRGPFQGADYTIAKTCIENRTHYIDLADARAFVTGFSALDADAKKQGVTLISGASTVPGLTSAAVEHYSAEFSKIRSLTFGIAPGQKAERGLATTQAILSYVGKKLKPSAGHETRYGWQDLYRQKYPEIGTRWMANCDVPDLDLLPPKYGIDKIRFSAGMENFIVHIGIWALSWLVRLGFPLQLEKHAGFLLKASYVFDPFGTADGGMHIVLEGEGNNGKDRTRSWFIIAKDGDGPFIPSVPAIILARKILNRTFTQAGALPCVGLVSLEEYMDELKDFKIKTFEYEM